MRQHAHSTQDGAANHRRAGRGHAEARILRSPPDEALRHSVLLRWFDYPGTLERLRAFLVVTLQVLHENAQAEFKRQFGRKMAPFTMWLWSRTASGAYAVVDASAILAKLESKEKQKLGELGLQLGQGHLLFSLFSLCSLSSLGLVLLVSLLLFLLFSSYYFILYTYCFHYYH